MKQMTDITAGEVPVQVPTTVVDTLPEILEGGKKKCPAGFVKDRRKGRSGCRSRRSMKHHSKKCPRGEIKDRRKGASKTSCRKARVHKTFNSKGKVVKRTYRVVSKRR